MTQQERMKYALSEIQSTQRVIEHCEYQGTPNAMAAFTIGALTSTLEGMAGLGDFATHASCFDLEVTQAIKSLVETINQRISPTGPQQQPVQACAKRPNACSLHASGPLSDF